MPGVRCCSPVPVPSGAVAGEDSAEDDGEKDQILLLPLHGDRVKVGQKRSV